MCNTTVCMCYYIQLLIIGGSGWCLTSSLLFSFLTKTPNVDFINFLEFFLFSSIPNRQTIGDPQEFTTKLNITAILFLMKRKIIDVKIVKMLTIRLYFIVTKLLFFLLNFAFSLRPGTLSVCFFINLRVGNKFQQNFQM